MNSPVSKKELLRLAELAKLKLDKNEAEKISKDLLRIVEYVAQLQEVDTADASRISYKNDGAIVGDVFRDDEKTADTNKGRGVDQFPEKSDGYLKVPPVL